MTACYICSVPSTEPNYTFANYNGKLICDKCQEGLEDYIERAKEASREQYFKALYEQEHGL